ncbi:mechanosensitive ion channel [Candidatus Gracilibacteria bacterium]|nr:mechanosensitive ion channel [Candidatus Gracilibacteria bacterium]
MDLSLENFDYTDISSYYDAMAGLALSYAPKIIGAIIVLWLGFKVANVVGKTLEKYLRKGDFDPTVERFVVNILKLTLKVMVLVAVVGILGVQTSSFVALFAAAGFALGGALSGTLGHFASGIVILGFRPFKIGDIVEIGDDIGTVMDISIFSTKIQTVDTKIVIIPNSDAIGGAITNYSMKDERQIDLEIGIGYSDSIDLAREVLKKIGQENEKVIKNDDHPIRVMVKSLGDSAVILGFRVWTSSDNYWGLRFELIETIKKEFDATNGKLNFPFPQQDVHHYSHDGSAIKEV